MPFRLPAALSGLAVILLAAAPANALSMAECSAKYNAAKEAGTLDGQKWIEFRKAQCAAGAGSGTEAAKADRKSKNYDTASAEPSNKLTTKECSARYRASKDAGTLDGLTWNEFRKAQCGSGSAGDSSAPKRAQAKHEGEPEEPGSAAPRGVKFPERIASKFAGETPSKARMHTCLEQYHANKDGDTLGGLRWVQKGGGYYSLCNAKLKALAG